MSLIVFYFLHDTSVLSFDIDVVLILSIKRQRRENRVTHLHLYITQSKLLHYLKAANYSFVSYVPQIQAPCCGVDVVWKAVK